LAPAGAEPDPVAAAEMSNGATKMLPRPSPFPARPTSIWGGCRSGRLTYAAPDTAASALAAPTPRSRRPAPTAPASTTNRRRVIRAALATEERLKQAASGPPNAAVDRLRRVDTDCSPGGGARVVPYAARAVARGRRGRDRGAAPSRCDAANCRPEEGKS